MKEQVIETRDFLTSKGFANVDTAIILGTGLGEMTKEIEIESTINYEDIPNFPVSTVEFHKGRLLVGTIESKRVIAMQGRFHFYEGYSMEQLVFPVRLFHELGVKQLLVSNASGNMNSDWKKGELMLIEDHINLLPDNPLRGKQGAAFGPIFIDMSNPYDPSINTLMLDIAREKNIRLNRGVYVAVAGPNLETRAEYRYLRGIGADVVGMSTVPEVIAANQLGLPVVAVSVLTDDCDPDNLAPVDIEDILATAKIAEKDMIILFRELIKRL